MTTDPVETFSLATMVYVATEIFKRVSGLRGRPVQAATLVLAFLFSFGESANNITPGNWYGWGWSSFVRALVLAAGAMGIHSAARERAEDGLGSDAPADAPDEGEPPDVAGADTATSADVTPSPIRPEQGVFYDPQTGTLTVPANGPATLAPATKGTL